MKMLNEFFTTSWVEALGWTLIHSLWQSLIVLTVVIVLLRFISGNNSAARYIIATGGLALILLLAASTFMYLISSITPLSSSQNVGVSLVIPGSEVTQGSGFSLDNLRYVLESNLPWITACWIAGTCLFSLRLVGSWWYVSTLRSHGTILHNEWSERLAVMTRQFNINKMVTLAESTRIPAPVVIGFLKPVILIPAGMLSGLSSEQIEAILLHELTHIRRHDYLINLLQSVVEALLFYNPFVWIISNIIRREREHCCDDTVVAHTNASVYAHALAQLEEKRLATAGFAVSLAENKNQLLTRIKRIMEKSVKHYSGREKVVPVLLLITGLVCASWLSVRTEKTRTEYLDEPEAKISLAGDTIIRKDKGETKSATYSRKSVTTIGPDGQPQEEVVESFEGDEDLRSLMMPTPPDAMAAIPPVGFPDMVDAFAPFHAIPDFDSGMDTIPAPSFHAHGDWDAFAEAFEKKFQQQFGDFYETHQKDLEKMMKEMELTFKDKFDEDWARDMKFQWEDQAEGMRKQAEEMARHAEAMAFKAHSLQDKQMEMQGWQKEHAERMKALEENMKKMEANMKRFQEAMTEQLVDDGYLKKGDKITNMHFDDDGDIEINGTEIKAGDKEKYRELHRKYFGDGPGNFRFEE